MTFDIIKVAQLLASAAADYDRCKAQWERSKSDYDLGWLNRTSDVFAATNSTVGAFIGIEGWRIGDAVRGKSTEEVIGWLYKQSVNMK